MKNKKQTPFSKLSKPEQRVKVAKDVLLQLKKKTYIASVGKYVVTNDLLEIGLKKEDDIRKNFKKIQQCRCCALGSCLLSITKFKNTLTVGDLGGGINSYKEKEAKKLFTMFSPQQLLLIENSFEGSPSDSMTMRIGANVFGKNTTNEQDEKCTSFYNRYDNVNDRLVAIMKNIVANKGTFKP